MCSIRTAKLVFAVLTLSLAVLSTFCSILVNNRIYGGIEANRGQFPYQISLREKSLESDVFLHTCSGSILSTKFIITAAHCIAYDPPLEDYRVFVDAHSQSDGEEYAIKAFIVHEENVVLFNDVGLIEVIETIAFSLSVAPIRLSREFIGADVRGVVSGWSDTDDSNMNLKYLEVVTVTNGVCRKIHPPKKFIPIYDFATLCAYSGVLGKGICHGDSGGPLVYNNKLIGIVSWNTNICANGYPDGFTRVSEYVNWVEQAMSKAM